MEAAALEIPVSGDPVKGEETTLMKFNGGDKGGVCDSMKVLSL